MSDRLEEFVKENKKQFELKEPSAFLWQKIEAELEQKKRKKFTISYQWMSAAAVLILSIGMYFGYQYKKMHTEIVLADINPAMGKSAVSFTSLIEEKRDSLQIFANENPELYAQFIKDIAVLDNDYQQLKAQLQNSPNKTLIGKAMMKNLETQFKTISQQLYIINRVNQYKEGEKSI